MDVHHDGMEEKVSIRDFDRDKDLEVVEKLERRCEIGSRRGFAILTNMLGDPLCRIRLYPLHVMLVAELVGSGEVVGVVRGCMKLVGTGVGADDVKIGCILGLRVSPKHRRVGIASELVKSAECWATSNGAKYIFVATEQNNTASINLFINRFDYVRVNSLTVVIQFIDIHSKNTSHKGQDVEIMKLNVEQAIALYKSRLGGTKFSPSDMDAILREDLSLGTWVSYSKGEAWAGLHSNGLVTDTPTSWAVLSIWMTYKCYMLQLRGAPLFRCFHSTMSHIRSKLLPCLKVHPACELLGRPFGFLFLYGLYGEGERMGELARSLWCFACEVGKNVKDCKMIVSELGDSDPLREHVVPGGSFISSIDDLWFLKSVGGDAARRDGFLEAQQLGNVFIDPRDF